MKLRTVDRFEAGNSAGSALIRGCVSCCRKILAQINAAKDAIFAESSESSGSGKHLLRLALNEAEALAWQTRYPHLVFPDLAMEKVQAVVAWNEHQRVVRDRARFPSRNHHALGR